MPRGVSLHVGINQVDPTHYPAVARLHGAENDAREMHDLAAAQGFHCEPLLLGSDARATVVQAKIAAIARTLHAGDTFLFTFAGHGAVMADADHDEPSGFDQTLCFYDTQLVDDVLFADLCAFRAGVRILVVSDSCHSGTVVSGEGSRGLTPEAAARIYDAHRPAYAEMRKNADATWMSRAAASILLLAACQDAQEAKDGAVLGRFTAKLLEVWDDARYLQSPRPSYRDLVQRVTAALNDPTQTPNLYAAGSMQLDLGAARPFVV